MFNPGPYTLAARQITTAITGEAQTAITDLEGATAVTIQAALAYGSGGTTAKADIETSLDGGTTWVPIARLAFTTASATKVVNLSGLTPKTTPYTPATLSDDTAVDGILGDRLRASITTTGTYGGSTVLAVRVAVR